MKFNSLRVLMVTGVYPTEQQSHAGTFIKSQVDSLIAAGLTVDILHPDPDRRCCAISRLPSRSLAKRLPDVTTSYMDIMASGALLLACNGERRSLPHFWVTTF